MAAAPGELAGEGAAVGGGGGVGGVGAGTVRVVTFAVGGKRVVVVVVVVVVEFVLTVGGFALAGEGVFHGGLGVELADTGEVPGIGEVEDALPDFAEVLTGECGVGEEGLEDRDGGLGDGVHAAGVGVGVEGEERVQALDRA